MRMTSIYLVVMMLIFVGAGNSYADQKIKTKSNIKNDRIAQPVASSECLEKCGEGEQCVKPAVTNSNLAETGKSYCVVISEEKSSASASEKP